VRHFAEIIDERARRCPEGAAYVVESRTRRARTYSNRELAAACNRRARALDRAGVKPGDRALVLIPPSFELFASVFAVMKTGATAVLIDPSMSKESLERCLSRVRPTVLLGPPAVHVLRAVRRRAFQSVTLALALPWSGTARLRRGDDAALAPVSPGPREAAAILFTSGATGVPKGCPYTHQQLEALLCQLRGELGLRQGDIDLTTLAVFGLFAPGLGMTSVLPAMDFARPGKARAGLLVRAADRNACTTMFGSPALLERLVEWGAPLATLRSVLCAGAPVSDSLMAGMAGLMRGEVRVPYGAVGGAARVGADLRAGLEGGEPSARRLCRAADAGRVRADSAAGRNRSVQAR
jgi:acyl-CoA synthetase (AMP-forming)/AMP-acid ligase II